jgi:diguanylate cyclase (GGDEF)-like protein
VAALREDIEAAPSVGEGLIRHSATLMALVDAGGLMIRCGGKTALCGTTPPDDMVTALVAAIRARHGESITHVDDVCPPDGAGSGFAESASGILMMPITNDPGDAIVWFRPEVVKTVQWAGDPNKTMTIEQAGQRISPRKSFAVWQEQRRGRSEPWTETDLLAVHELRRAIMAALLRQAEAKLAQLSAYDALTGLANRRTLETHIAGWRRQFPDGPVALMFLDLDRFKTVNDSLGHAAGDDILIETATRLRNLAPPGSVPGRLGGDEFVLFWPCASETEAMRLASLAVQDLARPMVLLGRPHYTTASVGVAFSATADANDMLRDADAAMYAAKRQGGARAVAFEPSLHAQVLSTMQLEQDLFAALQNGELAIHYQPVVGTPDGALYGFEALLRWHHPLRGWVAPSHFIPVAEDAGLIKDIGAWVMSGAIRQLAEWQRHLPDLRMSVNVSPRQLADDSLVTLLDRLLESEQVPPVSVGIEVTEGALMLEGAVRLLHEFRALGVRVAIDDFGTGYSSLSYLNKLPMDYVKIDRSFVTPLGSGEKAGRFLQAIVDLAHTLDLRCIAEGCETEVQWDAIAASGCDMVQGWLIAPALDAEAASAFVLAPGDGLPAWRVPAARRVPAGGQAGSLPH